MQNMRRRLPNLNALHAFEAAVRHESFKDAAEELNVTQSAVSHQIKLLEDTLGVALFRRLPRGVRATEGARKMGAELGQAFDRMRAAVSALSDDPMIGTLMISVAPFFGNRLVLPRLSRFHALYPGITVLPDMSPAELDFRKSEMDAGLRYGHGTWSGLSARRMHLDTLVPVAAPTVVEGMKLPLSPAEIAELPLGYIEADRNDWDLWFETVGYRGPRKRNMIAYTDRARVIDLAFSGRGVALADTALTAQDVEAGHLVRLNDHAVSPGRAMWLVYPETEFPDPRVAAFGDWFEAEVRAITRAITPGRGRQAPAR